MYHQRETTKSISKHCVTIWTVYKVSKGPKIRNRYNQVPHLTHDINGKVTKSQLDTTNESQEVSPFPAGDNRFTGTIFDAIAA